MQQQGITNAPAEAGCFGKVAGTYTGTVKGRICLHTFGGKGDLFYLVVVAFGDEGVAGNGGS